MCQPYIDSATTLSDYTKTIIGRAKRAPHWGVQSRFREVCRSVCMYVCRMSNHVESRESNTRMLKVSIGR